MRVPLSWLREHCDAGIDPAAIAERLTMTGTEVERVETLGVADPSGFVVGSVLAAEPHPNADRLRVCSLDVGDGEPRTIVCGAPNVAAGQTVAVALPGAVMADGTRLAKAKLRGVQSAGMILSETEMEIGGDADGIAVLTGASAAEPGTPLVDVLPIAETVLELEITPNRPDCLGVYGVARELAAATGAPLGPPPWAADAAPEGRDRVSDHASVRVEVPDLCPRFTARAFEDVRVGPSPLWLKARLTAAGQRPINNVVDITNYVMLLTGQPLHAFDLDLVPGGEIIVRSAAESERMRTLDGVERSLDSEAVLVCDRDAPAGIAGIMGGQVSEVSATTTRVLLEAACWNGPNLLRTSNRLALRSEASARFEKGLHPELTMRAQAIASRLFVELCGARLVPGTIDVDAGSPDLEPFVVNLRPERIAALFGIEIPRGDLVAYLQRLGFGVAGDGGEGPIRAAVPADRHFDVTREIDLIEEVTRLHGLEDLPATLPARASVGGLQLHQSRLRRLEDVLRDAGLDEAITSSLVERDRGRIAGLDEVAPVLVHNPLSEDGSAMRTDLIGGLLSAVARNLARGADRVGLFESGRAYLPERPAEGAGPLGGSFAGRRPAPVREPQRIACAIVGGMQAASWRRPIPAADFYDAKGLLELLSSAMGVELRLEPAARPFLHPARAAAVRIDDVEAGWVGELHPSILAAIDAESGVALEIDVAPLLAAATAGQERFEDVTTHPPIGEDLAVVAARGLEAERVMGSVREAGGALLRSVEVFDVYEGDQLAEGERSLALRLEFRAPDRTLTAAEVAPLRDAIVQALSAIGARLRG